MLKQTFELNAFIDRQKKAPEADVIAHEAVKTAGANFNSKEEGESYFNEKYPEPQKGSGDAVLEAEKADKLPYVKKGEKKDDIEQLLKRAKGPEKAKLEKIAQPLREKTEQLKNLREKFKNELDLKEKEAVLAHEIAELGEELNTLILEEEKIGRWDVKLSMLKQKGQYAKAYEEQELKDELEKTVEGTIALVEAEDRDALLGAITLRLLKNPTQKALFEKTAREKINKELPKLFEKRVALREEIKKLEAKKQLMEADKLKGHAIFQKMLRYDERVEFESMKYLEKEISELSAKLNNVKKERDIRVQEN